jgi:hypothetical protein
MRTIAAIFIFGICVAFFIADVSLVWMAFKDGIYIATIFFGIATFASMYLFAYTWKYCEDILNIMS